MAKSYTARIAAKAWKQHTCVSCGGTYTYLLQRTVSGRGTTAELAEQRAQSSVIPTLEAQVDQQPCPTCGLYQPDMIGQGRASRHNSLFWLALITFAVLIVLRPSYAVQANTLTFVSLVVAGIAVALHLLIDLRNPNADPASNRRLAEQRVQKGEMQNKPGKAGMPSPDKVSPPRSGLHTAAIGLLVVALLLIALPEAFRAVHHLPVNADSYPPVAGPGDTVRIYMNEKIQSIKGYWHGEPRASLIGPAGVTTVPAKTNDNRWGTTIRAKSSESNSNSTPWIELTIPNDRTLEGRQVTCELKLSVIYPTKTGSGRFDELERELHRTVTLNLAGTGAGAAYSGYWWLGTAGGMILIVISGVILANRSRALARLANKSQIFPVQAAPQPAAAAPPVPG